MTDMPPRQSGAVTELDDPSSPQHAYASARRKVISGAAIGTAIFLVVVAGLLVWRPMVGLVVGLLGLVSQARLWLGTIQRLRELRALEREAQRTLLIASAIARHKASGETKIRRNDQMTE